jgi:localization factor PodJL
MSTLDVKNEAGCSWSDGERGLPALTCEARDLKRFMTELADRIADADRRHSEALARMQERIGVLGTKSEGLREQLPREQSTVLERIEESMADLSSRLSDADTHNRPGNVEAASPPKVTVIGEAAAPALRSALAAEALDAYARRARTQPSAGPEPVDHFDVVDSATIRSEADVIDQDSADALARLYEASAAAASDAPALDAVTAVDMAVGSSAPATPTFAPEAASVPSASATAAEASRSKEEDRAWLEQRFADVAAKLEHALTDKNGGAALESFERRFASLEKQLTQAMAEAAKTADLAGLKAIESQVEDLGAQLVAVQTHFSRLDTIELELRSLAERMTSDELAKIIQHNAPKPSDSGIAQQIPRIEQTLQSIASQLSAEKMAGLFAQARPSGPDAGAIAKLVADEVTLRLPSAPADGPASADRLEDLRATLEAFVAEQRHGDQQTVTMLDTMQQAMIRLLDRMDAIEQDRYADEAVPHEQPANEAYDYRTHRTSAHDEQVPTVQHAAEPAPRVREVIEPLPPYEPQPSRVPQSYAPEPHMAPAAPRATIQQHAPIDPEPAAQAPDSRESYIAAARRAARMAAEAAPEQEVAPNTAAAPKARAATEKGISRKLSPVSMALMCIVLVGVSFIAVKSTILAPRAPQPAAQSLAPQSAPQRSDADKRIQNLEDADVLIENDAGRRGGDAAGSPPQRRSSLEGGNIDERAAPERPAVPTVPAALTKDGQVGAVTPRSNELPPLAIGPNSLRSAAAKGDPSAEFEVGARFAEGRGVQQDLQQAITWYQRAASQGYAPAQYRLGSMFERGLGVKTDLARARVWYQRAAEQGIVKAMHNLAVLSAGRDSSVTDYATAGKWFRSAAEHGLTDSQFNLAIMYDSGLGVDRDPKQAFKWFSVAARSGDEEAARRRESLRQKLLPQEILDVESEINAWRPKTADQTVNDPRMAGEAWKKGGR